MGQLNINMTDQFAKDLKAFMKARGVNRKSDAIRLALRESVERILGKRRTPEFTSWIGLGTKAPMNPRVRFTSDSDLWDSK